jgi:hypothetical protein
MSRVVARFAASLLLASLGAASASAQTMLSLQAGGIRSTLVGGAARNTDARIGLHGAVSFTIPFPARLGFRTGAALVQRGATVDSGSPGGGRIEIAMDYVQIPLLLAFNTASQRSLSAHALGGITPGFRVACSYAIPGFPTSDVCGEPVYVRGTYFEWLAGAGLTWRHERGAATLDFVLQQGMSSIYDDGADAKTRAFTLLAGVEFPLHRS